MRTHLELQPEHAIVLGSSHRMVLVAEICSYPVQSGDHYAEVRSEMTYFQGAGTISSKETGVIPFSFWAPRTRVDSKDRVLTRAIFCCGEFDHYRTCTLDLCPESEQKKLTDWLIERTLEGIGRKEVYLGCLPYVEFCQKFSTPQAA